MKPGAFGYQQQGVALITMLLVVAAIAVLSTTMIYQQRLAIREYGLMQLQTERSDAAQAAQTLAAAHIQQQIDSSELYQLPKSWTDPWVQTVLDQNATFYFSDAAARFNLNNLVQDGEIDADMVTIFKRLLTQLSLDPNLADALAARQQSAANSTSTTQEGLMRTLLSPGTLLEIEGFDEPTLQRLLPYISTVPYYVPINVNTASAEILASMSEGLNTQTLDALLKTREQTFFADVTAFTSQLPVPQAEQKRLANLLVTYSEAVTVEVVFERYPYLRGAFDVSCLPADKLADPSLDQNQTQAVQVSAFGWRWIHPVVTPSSSL